MMPTPKDLEAIDQDPDVLVNESEANIVITPRAAEVSQSHPGKIL